MAVKPRLIPLALTSFTLLACDTTTAQDKRNWPAELDANASVVEMVNWLEKTSFPHARVGVRTMSVGGNDGDSPLSPVLSRDARPTYTGIYSSGFKLRQIDGCNLVLKNDDAIMVGHSDMVTDPFPGRQYVAELYVPLFRMSYKKGKAPHRHTSNPEKSRDLGIWRTEFKSNRDREDVLLRLFSKEKNERLELWEAETLTFTFDSKEMSENFDAVFRRVIRMCKVK